MFYDEAWRELIRKHPLIARKIEDLRCEVVAYEQHEEEIKELHNRIDTLQQEINVLLKLNGVKRPPQITAK